MLLSEDEEGTTGRMVFLASSLAPLGFSLILSASTE